MREAVLTFAVLALVMVGGRYLAGRRLGPAGPRHVDSSDGAFSLRPPRRRSLVLAFIALVPATILGMMAFQARRAGASGLPVVIGATLLAATAPAYLVAYAVRSRFVVRETGVERIGVFRRRLVGWGAVAKVAFNPQQRWFFLTTSDRAHLWLPADAAGIGDFAAIALRRLRPAVLEADPLAREVLEDLAESRDEARR